MQKTLFDILTNEQARSAAHIQASVDQEFVAGAPWFNTLISALNKN